MAKYIIDIPDKEETMWEGFNGDLFIPITMNKGTKTWVNTDLKMIPYTEPDRKAIEDEVWQNTWKMFLTTEDFGATMGDSYSEAKAKYDAWKKSKEEIRVGCEVHHRNVPELIIYVTDMDDNSFGGFALCRVKDVCDYGDRFSECNVHQYKPTGRVFPNIVELLKKMEEE